MSFSFSRFVDKVRSTVGKIAAPVFTVAGAVFGGPAGAAAGAAIGAGVGALVRPKVLAPPPAPPGVVPFTPAPFERELRAPMIAPARPQIVRAVPAAAAAAAAMRPAAPGMAFLVIGGLVLALILFSR